MKSSRSHNKNLPTRNHNIPVKYIQNIARIAVLAAAITPAAAKAAPTPEFNGGTMYIEEAPNLSKAEAAYEKKFIARVNKRVSYDLQDGISDDYIYGPTFADGTLTRHEIKGHQARAVIRRPLVITMPPHGENRALDDGILLVSGVDRKNCTAHFRRLRPDETIEPTVPGSFSQFSFYFKQAPSGFRDFNRAFTTVMPNGEAVSGDGFRLLENTDGTPITDIGEYVAEAA